MTDAELRRELRLLKTWAIGSTVLLIAVLVFLLRRNDAHRHFGEIDAERINIVEPNGNLRVVLANRPRSIGPVYKGKPFGYAGGGRPGIIFFNDEGTENGGITFEGKGRLDSSYDASTHMSFDQFDQDQVLNLDYSDENGVRRTGISIDDRANVDIHDMVAERDSIMKIADTVARATALQRWAAPRNGVPLAAHRVFVGRDPARAAVLNLSDADGRVRARLSVDSLGEPSLDFLDASGKVTMHLPAKR
ncbi:MAG: hypothetical protein ACREL5_08045 [Gemmatimonadales bacterium]